jgi:hypothetical protein
MTIALDRGEMMPFASLEWLVPQFAQAADVIRPVDLHRLFADEPAYIGGRVTAKTILKLVLPYQRSCQTI